MSAAPGIHIHAVGGPTAILEIGGVRLITDPTFDEPREYVAGPGRVLTKTAPAALTPEQVGQVAAVLLSHDQHVDNLDLSGREYLSQVPVVLTTASATGRLGGACRTVALGEHVDLPRPDGGVLRVTRVAAQHGPDGTEDLVGEVAGFVLSGSGVPTVYVSGDNASIDVVRAVHAQFAQIDVAMLFVGAAQTPLLGAAYLTLTSSKAAEAAEILGADEVVPVHFNSWRHFTEDADSLVSAFAEAGLADRLTVLAPGESGRFAA